MTLNANVLRLSWREWIGNDLDPTTPGWLQWLWTLVLALVVALGFTLVCIASGAGSNPGLTFDANKLGVLTVIPAPSAALLLGMGGLVAVRRRR